MFSVTSVTCFVTSASRYQSKSSMYILGLIPRNSTELAEAVPIAAKHVITKIFCTVPLIVQLNLIWKCNTQDVISVHFLAIQSAHDRDTAHLRRHSFGVDLDSASVLT